jgi:hypothetical protein
MLHSAREISKVTQNKRRLRHIHVKINVFRLSQKFIFNVALRYVVGICEELSAFFDAENRRTKFFWDADNTAICGPEFFWEAAKSSAGQKSTISSRFI